MKRISLVLGIALVTTHQANSAIVPFPEFFVSVQTGDMRREKGQADLRVTVQCARSAENPQGRTSIDVDCFAFEASARVLDEGDQKIFLEAAAAAKDGNGFTQTVDHQRIGRGKIETQFESKQIKGAWQEWR